MLKPAHRVTRHVGLIALSVTSCTMHAEVPTPSVGGEWWSVVGNPDLGECSTDQQQPVDFAVWQAADGTWQLWSCIRNTGCGGHTRLFFRWEGRELTDSNWAPMGIAMTADTALGEATGGLQAPFVFKTGDRYNMVYGDWNRICLATSADGKKFTRKLNSRGQPDLFSGPYNNSRDPMITLINGLYHCYYTGHREDAEPQAAVFCRTSRDLEQWSEPTVVCAGGTPATLGAWFGADAECPFVVQRGNLFYLFRNQFYGEGSLNTQYVSENPLDFGVGDDQCRISTLPVAAPEIIYFNGEWFMAALNPGLDGVRIARLRW